MIEHRKYFKIVQLFVNCIVYLQWFQGVAVGLAQTHAGMCGRRVHRVVAVGVAPTPIARSHRVHGVGLAWRRGRRPGRRRVSCSSLGQSTTLRLPSWPHHTRIRYRCRVCWCYHATLRTRWCGLVVVGGGRGVFGGGVEKRCVVWCVVSGVRVGEAHRMCGMHIQHFCFLSNGAINSKFTFFPFVTTGIRGDIDGGGRRSVWGLVQRCGCASFSLLIMVW